MKVRVDPKRCTGHGRCYVLAPDMFDADEQGHSVVRFPGDAPPELEQQGRIGEANCPEHAITCLP